MVAAEMQEGRGCRFSATAPFGGVWEGKTFRSLATASRRLGERLQRVPHFDRLPGYSEWRAAFGHVIAFRRKCRFAKWTSLLPGTRPHRPVQQIHGLRPFFQHNARGTFGASAAKVRIHHMPPRIIAEKSALCARGRNEIGL